MQRLGNTRKSTQTPVQLPSAPAAELAALLAQQDAQAVLQYLKAHATLGWEVLSQCIPAALGCSSGLVAALLAHGPQKTQEEILCRTSFCRPADGRTVQACANPMCLAAAMDDLDDVKLLQTLQPAVQPAFETLLAADLAAWYRLARMGQGSEVMNWVQVLPADAARPVGDGEQGEYGAAGGACGQAFLSRDPLAAAIVCGAMCTALYLAPDREEQLSGDARRALAREYGDDPLARSVCEAMCAKYGKSPEEFSGPQSGVRQNPLPFPAEEEAEDQPDPEEMHAQFLEEMCSRYGLIPGEDWRTIEPLVMLDALYRSEGGPFRQAALYRSEGGLPQPDAQDAVGALVRRICELDDDVMLSVLYPGASELFLTPLDIPAGEKYGAMRLDAVCYCALLNSARCLSLLLQYGASIDGLNCAQSYNMIDFVGRDDSCPAPVTPMECALWGKSDDAQYILWMWGGKSIAELCGFSEEELPLFLPCAAWEGGPAAPEKPDEICARLLNAVQSGDEDEVKRLLDTGSCGTPFGKPEGEENAAMCQAALQAKLSPALFERLLHTCVWCGYDKDSYSGDAVRAWLEPLLRYAALENLPKHLRVLLRWMAGRPEKPEFLPEDLLRELVRQGRTECLCILLRAGYGDTWRGLRLWLQAETNDALRAAQRLIGPYSHSGEMPPQGPAPLPPSMTFRQAIKYASPAQLRRFAAGRGPLSLEEGRYARGMFLKEVRQLLSRRGEAADTGTGCKAVRRVTELSRQLDALLDVCPPLLEETPTQKLLVLLCLLPEQAPVELMRRLEGRPRVPFLLRSADPDFPVRALLASGDLLNRWQPRVGQWYFPVLDRNAPPQFSGWGRSWRCVIRWPTVLPVLLERCRVGGSAPQGRLSTLAKKLLRFGTPRLIMLQLEPGGMLCEEDPKCLAEYCGEKHPEIPSKNRAALAVCLKQNREYKL